MSGPLFVGYPTPLRCMDTLVNICIVVYGLIAGFVTLALLGLVFLIIGKQDVAHYNLLKVDGCHAWIKKVLSEGVRFFVVVFCCCFILGEEVVMRENRVIIPLKAAIVGLPAKRHLNGVSLACP